MSVLNEKDRLLIALDKIVKRGSVKSTAHTHKSYSCQVSAHFSNRGRNTLEFILPIQKQWVLVRCGFYRLDRKPIPSPAPVITANSTTTAVAVFFAVFMVSTVSLTSRTVFPASFRSESIGREFNASLSGSGVSIEPNAIATIIAVNIVPKAPIMDFDIVQTMHFYSYKHSTNYFVNTKLVENY